MLGVASAIFEVIELLLQEKQPTKKGFRELPEFVEGTEVQNEFAI